MMNFFNLRMIVQVLNNLQCVLYMTLYTKRQCFKSLEEDKGAGHGEMVAPVSRRRIARIFVTNAAGPHCFCKADSMIARVWLCQGREFTGCFPVEFTAVYDHTTDGCSMSTDEFGCRMNNDICTVLNRSYQVRSCKCVIYNQRDLMCYERFLRSASISTTSEFGFPRVSM